MNRVAEHEHHAPSPATIPGIAAPSHPALPSTTALFVPLAVMAAAVAGPVASRSPATTAVNPAVGGAGEPTTASCHWPPPPLLG
jgi:hypothetical protein